ncbi:hypothetical protein BV25DRAFT_1987115 [Artomyces pyxidatus]|uniref:Uncharacterized protein n=1 Tax=Artomyces pyxidatus TaxID=48021 RepID=A0ACB8TIK8_9AGAM|nr:hypothetical protein BV25DRAFT_1987115 [Artomyces pyxidatus]
MSANIRELLGLSLSSHQIASHLSALSLIVSTCPTPTPEVKSYPDAVYFNYYALGISLLFVPINPYKPTTGLGRDDLNGDSLILDGIDIYNSPALSIPPDGAKTGRTASSPIYSPYPSFPLLLSLSPETKEGAPVRVSTFPVTQETTGKEFITAIGEPDRKGGGAGPSSGSIGIWVEWSKDGLMVEFGGEESRGPQAWERGKDAMWKVISIFPPKSQT